MINNTLSAGIQGVNNGISGMQDAASRIARAGTTAGEPHEAQQASLQDAGESGGLAEPIVDLRINQRGVEASTAVVRTADEMLGTLLDEKA